MPRGLQAGGEKGECPAGTSFPGVALQAWARGAGGGLGGGAVGWPQQPRGGKEGEASLVRKAAAESWGWGLGRGDIFRSGHLEGPGGWLSPACQMLLP